MPIKTKSESGAVFVELVLVLPILLIILAGAFEVSRTINYKNAAIQISSQAANEVYRECTSDKGILMSDCISRIQRDMTDFAMQNYPNYNNDQTLGTSHVAITVYFNRSNNHGANNPIYQYTARADTNQFTEDYDGNPAVFNFSNGIQIDNWDALSKEIGATNAELILQNTDYLVVAQTYLRYRPIGLLFGSKIFSGDFITDYTVI